MTTTTSRRTRYTKAQHRNFDKAARALGTEPVSAAGFGAQLKVSDPTANRVLKRNGFVQASRGKWVVPVEPVLTHAPAEADPEPTVLVAPDVVEPETWTLPVPAKLQAKADEMGLRIEVRVWRGPVG